ncbi:hypothetical protein [Streptomyces sp. NPDC058757]|uniref:hypothetical protein n=1 Tax=Streptomyces sp. NPDC058757 TaxID=3346626 RepID=UPI0036D0C96C
MRRALRAVVATLFLWVGSVAFLAPPASAGVLDLTCAPPTSVLNSYSPALTAAPQTVTVSTTALYGPCVSPSQPAIISGTRTASVTTTTSCADLLGPGTFTYTITWNTGQTSTLSTNYTRVAAGGVYTVTATGVVTAGVFAGDTVVVNYTGPSTDITLCTLGLGTVSSLYLPVGTLELTSI